MGCFANTLDSLQDIVYHEDTEFLKLRVFVCPWFN